MSIKSLMHPTILSSLVPFSSCLQSFPASESLPVSWLFVSKDWSFSISPSSEYSGLISFRMDWLDLLAAPPRDPASLHGIVSTTCTEQAKCPESNTRVPGMMSSDTTNTKTVHQWVASHLHLCKTCLVATPSCQQGLSAGADEERRAKLAVAPSWSFVFPPCVIWLFLLFSPESSPLPMCLLGALSGGA